mgnify:CR=1 FL=1
MKSGFVALIGRPNVGKSTLMNRLIGQKIAITSDKPQTTRNKIQTVYTDERGQIVFFDTPGIHKAANKLGEYMVGVAEKTMDDADVLAMLVEPTTYIGAGEEHILESLAKASVKSGKTPVFLIINKIDTVDAQALAECIQAYKDKLDFTEIIPVSATKGTGCEDLLATIYKHLPEGPMFYDEDTLTDQPLRQIVAELIREKALTHLKDEVPHGIAVVIESMKQRSGGLWDIDASIVCERESYKGIVIGKGGAMLKKIGSAARYEIEQLLEDKANLQLHVKVRDKWRDSDLMLKNFGYDQKND